MHACVYVCMHVCMHVCTHVCMHVCMHVPFNRIHSALSRCTTPSLPAASAIAFATPPKCNKSSLAALTIALTASVQILPCLGRGSTGGVRWRTRCAWCTSGREPPCMHACIFERTSLVAAHRCAPCLRGAPTLTVAILRAQQVGGQAGCPQRMAQGSVGVQRMAQRSAGVRLAHPHSSIPPIADTKKPVHLTGSRPTDASSARNWSNEAREGLPPPTGDSLPGAALSRRLALQSHLSFAPALSLILSPSRHRRPSRSRASSKAAPIALAASCGLDGSAPGEPYKRHLHEEDCAEAALELIHPRSVVRHPLLPDPLQPWTNALTSARTRGPCRLPGRAPRDTMPRRVCTECRS